MYITYQNKEQADCIYVHDSSFTGFLYDYDKRKIILSCKNTYLNKKIKIVFSNVVNANLQSCSFWHGGNSIVDFFIDDSSVQEQMLRSYGEKNNWIDGSYLDRGTSFLSVILQINSGDVLEILCEGMEYTERILPENGEKD